MDDKTRDILNRLKEYFDNTEITKEGFENTSRIALMSVSYMGMLSAHLAPSELATELVKANFEAINGLSEISKIVGAHDNIIKMPSGNQTSA